MHWRDDDDLREKWAVLAASERVAVMHRDETDDKAPCAKRSRTKERVPMLPMGAPGSRIRRKAVAAYLRSLNSGPKTATQVMGDIGAARQSVITALKANVARGFVNADKSNAAWIFGITDAGREWLAENG